ncbi:MAG: flagellar hook protein FlgE [Sneathiellaceae bacterium]
MSLFSALYAGVTGMNSQSTAMAIISDNITNVQTVGYKKSSSAFQTLVTNAGQVDAYSAGGVRVKPVANIDEQGLLQASTSATDIGINGQGFFPVAPTSTSGDRLFTRAGEFKLNADGYLTNTAGYNLLGLELAAGLTDAQINALSVPEVANLTPVRIANFTGTARATTSADLNSNLPANAADTDNYTTTIQVFDQKGLANNIQLTFTYDAAGGGGTGAWDIAIGNPTLASDGSANGTITPAAGTAEFAATGAPSALPDFSALVIDWGNSTTDSTVDLDIGTVGQTDGLTNYGENFSVSAYTQDGYKSGNFTGMAISNEGIVSAQFDNGQSQKIYRIPIVAFQNANGLSAETGNVFRETVASGNALENWAGTGRSGLVSPNSLEQSTTDLATEFADMIVTQRAYSASGKLITTSDEMLEEIIRLKR